MASPLIKQMAVYGLKKGLISEQCLPCEQHIWSLVETVLKPAAPFCKAGLIEDFAETHKLNEENMYLL